MQAISQPVGPHTGVLLGLVVHATPHAPQFWVSSSLMQAPLHGPKPSAQAMPQPLASQVAEPFATDGQALSQLVQCAGSIVVSTQAPPQFVVPPGQPLTHLPTEQASVAPHGLSQPPQLAGLVLVSTQAEPHSAKPCAQALPHLPPTHTPTPLAGASQAFPHSPQF